MFGVEIVSVKKMEFDRFNLYWSCFPGRHDQSSWGNSNTKSIKLDINMELDIIRYRCLILAPLSKYLVNDPPKHWASCRKGHHFSTGDMTDVSGPNWNANATWSIFKHKGVGLRQFLSILYIKSVRWQSAPTMTTTSYNTIIQYHYNSINISLFNIF